MNLGAEGGHFSCKRARCNVVNVASTSALLKSFELLVNNSNKDAYAGQLDSFTHLRALLVLHPSLVKFLPLCVTNVTVVTFALFYVTIVLFYVTVVLSYVPIVVKCF